MSYPNSSSFYPVDEFALDYRVAMDQDSAPTRFLGDNSITFFSGMDSTGILFPGNSPYFSMDTLNYQESSGLVPYDSTGFLRETPRHIGNIPPSVANYVPATSQRSNGKVTTQDNYRRDLNGYMDKHGKPPPHPNAFVREDFGFRPVAGSTSNHVSSNIPTTPVRKPVAPLSHSSALTVSSDHATVNRATPKEQVHLGDIVVTNDPKATHASDALTEKRHLQSESVVQRTNTFSCTQPGCDKTYAHLNSLKRHMKTCWGNYM